MTSPPRSSPRCTDPGALTLAGPAGSPSGWRPRGEQAGEDPAHDVAVPVDGIRARPGIRGRRGEQFGQPRVPCGGQGVLQVGGVALLPLRAAGELVLGEQLLPIRDSPPGRSDGSGGAGR